MKGRPIVTLLLLIGLTLAAMAPALSQLRTSIIGDGGDNYQFLGFQYLARHLIVSGGWFHGWTDYWRYPAGIDVQGATDSMLFMTIGLLLYVGTSDPVLVYNLSVLVLVFLNLACSYAAFRTWFDRRLALLGAIIYGLSFFSLSRVGGHVNLIATAGYPLFFSSLYRIYKDDGRTSDFMLLSASMVYLTMASLQHPLLVIAAMPFIAGLMLVFERDAALALLVILWRKKGILSASLILSLLAVAPFEGRRVLQFMAGKTIMPAGELVRVPAINFFLPNAYTPTIASAIPNGSRAWIEYGVFLGFAEVAVLAAALWGLRKAAGFRLLAGATVVFFALSLGVWPYPVLYHFLPYRGILEPGRLYVILYLAVTLLILLFIRRTRSPALYWTVLACVCLERVPMHAFHSPTLREPELIAAVQSRPTHAVLDLPAYDSWWNGQVYDLYSVHYQRPIVNGYFHWSGDVPESRGLVDRLREYRCYFEPGQAVTAFDPKTGASRRDELIDTLEKSDIRAIVIHKDLFGSETQCGAARQFIDALVDQRARWEVLLDTPAKQVLWLKRE